jgi:hypothetical protein
MTVFVSFSDESGIPDSAGDFLVSGYAAEESAWQFITASWQEMLDGPPKIPYLHMNEIRHQEWREEHGISHLDSQDRVDAAVHILSVSKCLSVVRSVMNRADLAAIVHGRFKSKTRIPIHLREPDYFCFLAYLVFTLAEVSKKTPAVDKVDFVVSRKERITHHLHSLHRDIGVWLKHEYPQLEKLMGDIIPASMDDRLPLQAADVLCWHQQKSIAGTEEKEDNKRLIGLLGDTDGFPHRWEREDLAALMGLLIQQEGVELS